MRLKSINVFKKGAIAALDRGPKIGGNIINTQIVLHNLKIGRGTADSFLMSAAAQCVQKVCWNFFCYASQLTTHFFPQILMKGGCRLLEPIMAIEIVSPSDRISPIMSDLSKRRATILNVASKGELNKVISHSLDITTLCAITTDPLSTGHQRTGAASRTKRLF